MTEFDPGILKKATNFISIRLVKLNATRLPTHPNSFSISGGIRVLP